MPDPVQERDPRIAWMPATELRARFLEYFEERGHTMVPSSSLVPAGDNSLLFVNSGMVPFKDALTGAEKRSYTRAVNFQRCLRVAGKHNDFEEVGRSPRHHTFFEMLGNWSFGDYFKREAIHWAWEFLTKDLGIPGERLAATVYSTDDEAHAIWKDEIGLPPERLVRWGDFPAGDEKNWWRMADTGPSGPCSEIHFDRGPQFSEGDFCVPDHSEMCPRWLEIWNLVFMQYELHPDRSLTPLPAPGVDTGMGLERLTSVVQQVPSNYDTDLFEAIHSRMRELFGHDPDAFEAERFSYQVIADHSRAITFLLADGVQPSNEGRGYVCRRIIRRAVRHGRLLGRKEPFLAEAATVVIDTMGDFYGHLRENETQILTSIAREEEQFGRTLADGSRVLERAITQSTTTHESVSKALSGLNRGSVFEAIARLQKDPAGLQAALGQMKSPAFDAIAKLQKDPAGLQSALAQMQRSPVFDAIERLQKDPAGLQAALSQMKSPAFDAIARFQRRPAVGASDGQPRAADPAELVRGMPISELTEAKDAVADVAVAAATGVGAALDATIRVEPSEASSTSEVGKFTLDAVIVAASDADQLGEDVRALVDLADALNAVTGGRVRVIGRKATDLSLDSPELSGEVAFRLHDTYGFPIDVTTEFAAEYGVRVDREGFDQALAEQRDRSRSGTKADKAKAVEAAALYESIRGRSGDTTFVGYETTSAEARIVAILRNGTEYQELEAKGEAELRFGPGAAAELVLDRTPFYPEGGGQIGDHGALRTGGAAGDVVFEVEDTQRVAGTQAAGLIVHRGTLRGKVAVGDTLSAEVDAERRANTMRNHTGTHLLHRALRNVVGDRAKQAGSLVTPDGLRFDFPFERGLTDDEERSIEDEVRRIVREDRPVTVEFLPMTEAIERGADAFFDEKYGETVRTVRVQDYSFELCGGTHCRASGQIGSFVITGERSIGSGVRRIEALTGAGADSHLRARLALLDRATEATGAISAEAIPERIAALQAELKDTKRRLREGGRESGLPRPGDLRDKVEAFDGVSIVTLAAPFESSDAMKGYAKDLRSALGANVIALALDADEPQVFVTADETAVAKGVNSGDLVKLAVGAIDGKGGGRPEMAQGRGTKREGIAAALAAIREHLAATASR